MTTKSVAFEDEYGLFYLCSVCNKLFGTHREALACALDEKGPNFAGDPRIDPLVTIVDCRDWVSIDAQEKSGPDVPVVFYCRCCDRKFSNGLEAAMCCARAVPSHAFGACRPQNVGVNVRDID